MTDSSPAAPGGVGVRWLCAFIDLPAHVARDAELFWSTVAGQPTGEPSGDRQEFVPLQPADGDPHLWFQHIGTSEPGVHPDLSVEDLAAAVQAATSMGAGVVRGSDRLVAMSSPGGLPFCLVPFHEERRASTPVDWPSGASMVDQLCIDVPLERIDGETRFWAQLTGWRLQDHDGSEFATLTSYAQLPMRFLLQRLDEWGGRVRAHLDLASERRDLEVDRHRVLGAQPVRRTSGWTTLRDPAGLAYCVTDRKPSSNLRAR